MVLRKAVLRWCPATLAVFGRSLVLRRSVSIQVCEHQSFVPTCISRALFHVDNLMRLSPAHPRALKISLRSKVAKDVVRHSCALSTVTLSNKYFPGAALGGFSARYRATPHVMA